MGCIIELPLSSRLSDPVRFPTLYYILKASMCDGEDLLKMHPRTCNHRFSEDWKNRAEMISTDKSKQQTYINYPKYPDINNAKVKEFCAQFNAQLALYRGKKGGYGREWLMDSAEKMPAYLWWDQCGSSTPQLQAVARSVLAQPGSASICERINSEFEFVKDRRRNRLHHSKANKLVGLFHNLRLLKRMNQRAYVEPAVAWSADELHSGIAKFGIENY